MTSDQTRLAQYVDAWKAGLDDAVALLRSLDELDWSRPTDLPGWDVRAVASHLAHLESELSGVTQEPVDVPELTHVKSPMSVYTEKGPLARRGHSPAQIIQELETAAAVRHEQLRRNPPRDPAGEPPITPGGVGWSWETLLSNRVVDVWMHEQDIRRAVGRPGNLGTAAAAHTVGVFAGSFGYAVGKRVAPPPGTTAVLDVSGPHPVHVAVEMNELGRAIPLSSDPERPTVSLAMDLESFVILAGGRRPVEAVSVSVDGDRELADRILAAMAVTP